MVCGWQAEGGGRLKALQWASTPTPTSDLPQASPTWLTCPCVCQDVRDFPTKPVIISFVTMVVLLTRRGARARPLSKCMLIVLSLEWNEVGSRGRDTNTLTCEPNKTFSTGRWPSTAGAKSASWNINMSSNPSNKSIYPISRLIGK